MSRNYDTAAEFCEIAGTPDLLEYLQLPPDVSAEDAQAKLKARRKYMQGMQSNPKYRKEAIFLIKNFTMLSAALEDPAAYQLDALRRAESVHLPILEMTVKGVLAGGGLTEDQETYLRRNANELGVSDATFDTLLDRLCGEAGVKRPGGGGAPTAALHGAKTLTPHTAPPARVPGDDFYRLLELEKGASLNQIRSAYEAKMAEARKRAPTAETEALIVRLDLAWSVLSDPRARETYHITQTRTGPPARNREAGPHERTAPPVRRNISGSPAQTGPAYSPPGGATSRLEILGDPVRSITLNGTTRTVVRVRNGGSEPMTGRISSEQPWVQVNPRQIDPHAVEQDIEVTFEPAGMPGSTATAVVNIVTDRGERAAITFHAGRDRTLVYAAVGGGLALIGLLALGVAFMGSGPSTLRVEIDPWSEAVKLDGEQVGSGRRVTLKDLDSKPHVLEVTQPNFQPYKRELTEADLDAGILRVELQQDRRLDFRPTDEMRRTSIPQDEASKVFSQRSSSIDACIERVVQPGSVLTGAIRVHIDKGGLASGLETQGKHTDSRDVARCLERQAAALVFSPLQNGDYATVRYEYTVTAADGP